MKINPNVTPQGISLDEIRKIARRNLDRVRFFDMESRGHTISVVALSGVYLSSDFGDSRYFAEQMPEFVNGRFLEIGVGTGLVTIAIILGKNEYSGETPEKHVGIDIDPRAARNTRINAMINGVEDKIDVRQGDIFEPLEKNEKFDCIFWNHPFYKGNAGQDIDLIACFDPLFRGLEKYVKDGHRFLNEGGKLLLGSGNFADLDDMREIMSKHGCKMDLMHYVHRPFKGKLGELNTYNIYEIRKKISRDLNE